MDGVNGVVKWLSGKKCEFEGFNIFCEMLGL